MAYKIERKTLSDIAAAIKENYSVSSLSVGAFSSAIKDVKNSFIDGRIQSASSFVGDSTLTKIGTGAFAFTGSKDYDLPNVSDIEPFAFYSANINNFNFNVSNFLHIGSNAFRNANFIQDEVTLNISGIDSNAFQETSIGPSGKGRLIFSTKSSPYLLNIGDSCFYSMKCAEIICPRPVLTGSATFYNMSNLTNVFFTFPSHNDYGVYQIPTIPKSAFFNCTSLKSVTIAKNPPNSFDYGVGANIGGIYDYAFYSCRNLKSVDFSCPYLTSLGSYAFQGCSMLSAVSLNNFSTVGAYAFQGCSILSKCYMPQVSGVSYYAFSNCYLLEDATFSALRKVDQYAFCGCSRLKMQDLNFTQIEAISAQAFRNAGGIYSTSTFYLNCSDIQYIGSSAFENTTVNKLSFNTSKLSYLGSYAFQSCRFLKEIELTNVEKNVYQNIFYYIYTFRNCSNLSKIILNCSEVYPLKQNYSTIFASTPFVTHSISCGIYVPSSLVDSYKAAVNWSALSNYIFAIEN